MMFFNFFKSKNFNIVCLQDTHFTADEENFIQTKWGYKCFFSSYRSNARGVSIFLTDSFEYVVHNVHKGNNGNMIALNITIEKLKITLIRKSKNTGIKSNL